MNKTIKTKMDIKKKEIEVRSLDNALKQLMDEIALYEEEIENIKEEEEIEAKFEELDKSEKDKAEILAAKSDLEEQIKSLRDELENEEEEKEEEVKVEKRSVNKAEISVRGGLNMNKLNLRTAIREVIKNEEDNQFFRNIIEASRSKKRATTMSEVEMPSSTKVILQDLISEKSRLYDYVDVRRLANDIKVTVTTIEPEAVWGSDCSPLVEDQNAVKSSKVELNSNKISSMLFICKAVIEDSVEDIAEYVLEELSRAIANKIDEGILTGTGVDSEPEGILTKVTEKTEIKGVLDIVIEAGLLEEKAEVPLDNVIAVVNKKTMYDKILREAFGKDSNGLFTLGVRFDSENKIVNLPDGTRVIPVRGMPDNEVLVGDFKAGYILAERVGIELNTNESVRFIEDDTVFAARGRYDGKVKNENAFVRLNFTQAEV